MKADQIRRLLNHGFSIEISLNGVTEKYYPTKDGRYAVMYTGFCLCGFCGRPYRVDNNWFGACACDESLKMIGMTDLYKRLLDVQKESSVSAKINAKAHAIVLSA